MKKITILGPSKIHGIGVFTRFLLKKGENVNIWDKKDCKKISKRKMRLLCMKQPELRFFFERYCVESADYYWCPLDFVRMSVGWYLNHSNKPNICSENGEDFYALRNIKIGEELLIDYKNLDDDVDNRI